MAHIRNIEKILQVEPPIPRELPNSYVFFHMCINCALFPWAASNLSLSPYKHSLWLILGMIPNATLRLDSFILEPDKCFGIFEYFFYRNDENKPIEMWQI